MARDVFGDEVNPTQQPVKGPTASTPVPEPNWWKPSNADAARMSSPAFGPTGPQPITPIAQEGAGRLLGPPFYILAVATLCIAASILIGFAALGRPALAITGWAVGGFVAILLLAWYTLADAARRTDAWYVQRDVAKRLRGVLAAGSIVAVGFNAYQFADWLSRR